MVILTIVILIVLSSFMMVLGVFKKPQNRIYDQPPSKEPDPTELCNAQSTSCTIVHSSLTTNGSSQSTTASSSRTRPSVLYYNTHGGTNMNMKGIMKSLSLELDIFNPKQVTNYGMSHARAKALIDGGHVEYICSLYDIIIIGDTIPHGRALMQSLLERPNRQCKSKIVVEMTNRFDWDVKDRRAYYAMVKQLVLKRRDKIYWVANNNVEQAFLEFLVQVKMPDVRILRPIGTSKDYEYPTDLPAPSAENFASRTHDTTNIFSILRDQFQIPITIFPFGHKYGGPKNLLQFKGFIDIPYQYSVMKFYENIAYGVPQYIPTPRLFEYMLETGLHYTHCIFPNLLKQFPSGSEASVKLIPSFPQWSAYMDYYDPLFAPYVYYFDSFVELQNMRLFSRDALDWKNVKEKGPEFYSKYRLSILEGWAELFRDMGFDEVIVKDKGGDDSNSTA
ncbi:hypothetical protein BDR26DRAFT_891514 [Obelidium mucronatum]|nr:hypothetical protein BDR26DRAFT_891514 [Obelidium mucronatum]